LVIRETKIMKKIVLVLAVMISAFAASAQKMASASAETLTKGKSSGVYVFTLPAEVTTEKVEELKKYYDHYFTTAFDQGKHEVKFTLTENEPLNRRVISRFMAGVEVKEYKVGDKTYASFDALFDQYMK